MMGHPKISVVTLSYNQKRFLHRAIESVLDQGYPNVELIIVDAGSTDGSRELVESYGDRISVKVFEKDNGPADGLAKGFARATGEILAQLNSDDCYLPGTLHLVARQFELHPECGVLYGHGLIADEAGRVKRMFYSDGYSLWRAAHGCAIVCQQSTFYRRSAYELVGGINTQNNCSWDGELLIDFAMKGVRFRRVNQILGVFSIWGGSITGSAQNGVASKANHDRIFVKAMGRRRRRSDVLFRLAGRALRYVESPLQQARSLISRSSGRVIGLKLEVIDGIRLPL